MPKGGCTLIIGRYYAYASRCPPLLFESNRQAAITQSRPPAAMRSPNCSPCGSREPAVADIAGRVERQPSAIHSQLVKLDA